MSPDTFRVTEENSRVPLPYRDIVKEDGITRHEVSTNQVHVILHKLTKWSLWEKTVALNVDVSCAIEWTQSGRFTTRVRWQGWRMTSVSPAFTTGTHTVTLVTLRSAHTEMDRPIRRSSLPPLRLNKPVISVQAQSFLYWLAAPGLLPGAWLQQLSSGFMRCRATGAVEFVATVHVVCSPTSLVVVSALPVPEIHCGLLFVFNFSLLWAKQKYSSGVAQQDSSDSGMFRLKIRDMGFLA